MRKLILVIFIFSFTSAFCFDDFINIFFDHEALKSELVQELIESPAMERLKGVDQSGISRYVKELPSFTRFDHCVGVFLLLKRFQAPEEECIAGLLHDASHTVFSHVADYLFGEGDGDESYQDTIHLWYLKEQGIDTIVAPYGFDLEDLDPKNKAFRALEQNLPNMCADRIEYNIHTAYIFGLLSEVEVREILDDLRYENGEWFFQTPSIAKKIGLSSIYFTNALWSNPDDMLSYQWMAKVLKRALQIGVITFEEIHFTTDLPVLDKLFASCDAEIQTHLNYVYEKEVAPGEYFLKGKFRGINPLVAYNGTLVQLTDLDEDFAVLYFREKKRTEAGHHIKLQATSFGNSPQRSQAYMRIQ